MIISLEAKLAFLAMPKAASTAIETVLAPQCEIVFSRSPRVTHMTVRRYTRFLVPFLRTGGFKDVETCCLFRQPISWLASWYQYFARPDFIADGTGYDYPSFDAFAAAYIAGEDKILSRIAQPWDFLRTREGENGITHLFRYEEFGRFEDFIAARFGRRFEFRRINTSPQRDISLSPDMTRQLETFFAREFEIYDTL